MNLLLLLSILGAAVLYSTVGYGGASGYLAVMALFGMAPSVMRPAVLTMNVFVTLVVLYRLGRAGHFRARLFLPFAVASVPFAYIGGLYTLQDAIYSLVVGIALLLAAVAMLGSAAGIDESAEPPPGWLIWPVAAALGLLSGLTGVGGGIYLSPLALMMRWTTVREAAALAAAFILVNSLAGVAGFLAAGGDWPDGVPAYVITAVGGALIGAELGSRRLPSHWLRRILALVLAIAGLRIAALAFA